MTVDGELVDLEDGWKRFESDRSDVCVRTDGETVEFKSLELLVDLSALDEDSAIPGADEMMESAVRALAEERYGETVPWEVAD